MNLRLKERATAFKNRFASLMDENPLAAAGAIAGIGAVLGLVIGVALA